MGNEQVQGRGDGTREMKKTERVSWATIEEICNSLQMTQSVVVSICRQLVASSLLNFDDVHYQIDPIWFPWVEANLVQKRFIGSGDRG